MEAATIVSVRVSRRIVPVRVEQTIVSAIAPVATAPKIPKNELLGEDSPRPLRQSLFKEAATIGSVRVSRRRVPEREEQTNASAKAPAATSFKDYVA